MKKYTVGLFGAWLRDMMDLNNFTVWELAYELDISKITIDNHLHMRKKPYRSTLHKYAEFFDCDYWELYAMVEEDWYQKAMSEHAKFARPKA